MTTPKWHKLGKPEAGEYKVVVKREDQAAEPVLTCDRYNLGSIRKACADAAGELLAAGMSGDVKVLSPKGKVLVMVCVAIEDLHSLEIQPTKGTFVSEWGSGHKFESACECNLATRTVEVLESHDAGEDVEDLQAEYVLLGDKRYKAAPEDMRSEFTKEEQAEMFFYD